MNILPTIGLIAVEVTEEQRSVHRGTVIALGKPNPHECCPITPAVGDDVLFTMGDDFLLFEDGGREVAFIYPQDLVAVLTKDCVQEQDEIPL